MLTVVIIGERQGVNMVGIEAYGVYIPLWRLDLQSLPDGGRGERAIANFDEDSLTMGVAAGRNCLEGYDPKTIDGLFFATTTSPYKEKQISVTAATALDLRSDIITADFANSLRAGTTALMAAVDAVKAGRAKQVLVVASDMRPALPGSEFERTIGDGAVAFIVGDEGVGANIQGSHSVSDEIHDVWRSDEDRFPRSWETRFVLDEGYFGVLPDAVAAFMKKCGLVATDISKVVFNGPDSRRHREMAKALGFDPTKVQDPMFGVVGDTGAAFCPMMLAAAFDQAKPGEKLLVANYSNGADILILAVTRTFASKHEVKSYVSSKKVTRDYLAFLRWHDLIDMAVGGRKRPEPPAPSASAMWREVDRNIRLHGMKCNNCGAIQYPKQKVCFNCRANKGFEDYCFAGRKGTLFTYSADSLTPTLTPPSILAVVDFEGGGRMWLNMTDRDVSEIKIGMPVEMTFRRIYSREGIHNYYWECMPVRIPLKEILP